MLGRKVVRRVKAPDDLVAEDRIRESKVVRRATASLAAVNSSLAEPP